MTDQVVFKTYTRNTAKTIYLSGDIFFKILSSDLASTQRRKKQSALLHKYCTVPI